MLIWEWSGKGHLMKIILFIVDVRWLGARVAPWVTPAMEWRLGVVVVTTTQLHSPKPQLKILRKFKSCSQCVGDLRWWVFLAMVPAGNKTKRLASVNHSAKTIHHHHHRHHHGGGAKPTFCVRFSFLSIFSVFSVLLGWHFLLFDKPWKFDIWDVLYFMSSKTTLDKLIRVMLERWNWRECRRSCLALKLFS